MVTYDWCISKTNAFGQKPVMELWIKSVQRRDLKRPASTTTGRVRKTRVLNHKTQPSGFLRVNPYTHWVAGSDQY